MAVEFLKKIRKNSKAIWFLQSEFVNSVYVLTRLVVVLQSYLLQFCPFRYLFSKLIWAIAEKNMISL